MNYAEYRDLIRSKGKGVVVFRKLDNTLRTMNFDNSKGVVKGGVSGVAHLEKYMPCFDTDINQWRTVNLETIVSLKV